MRFAEGTDPEFAKEKIRLNRKKIEQMEDFFTIAGNSNSPNRYAEAYKTVYGSENKALIDGTPENEEELRKVREVMGGNGDE